jgi:UDP-N-acetylmuramoylalanine-D-glutamate ligase
VPIGNAATIVLPLGPHHLAALSDMDEYVEIPQRYVDRLNGFQVANAKHQVFMRPKSGLEGFIAAFRSTP